MTSRTFAGSSATCPLREFEAQGLHPTGAVRTVSFVLERGIVGHLGEHAAQLERLASVGE